MNDSDSKDMTGMPSHVVAAMEAALKQEKQFADAQPRQAAAPAEASVPAPVADSNGGQQAEGSVPAPDGAEGSDQQPTQTDDVNALNARIAELEAMDLDKRNRLRRLQGQQRVSRQQMEDEVKNLKAQIKRMEEEQTAAPKADDSAAILLRNGFTQEEIDDMSPTEIKREARAFRANEELRRSLLAQREDLDRRLTERQNAGKVSAADAAIEQARPGFLDAIKSGSENEADWQLFSSDVNPDSDAGLTWGETLAHARKVGDRATVLRVADLFAKDAGIKFTAATASASTSATRVDVPPRRVMPSSGPAAPASPASSTEDTTASSVRYTQSYAEEFFNRTAPLRGGTFRPITISKGGRSKSFQTEKAMEREYQALLLAAEEGRIDRG